MNFNMMQLFRTLVVTAFVPAALLSGVNVFAEQLHVRLRDNVELKSHVVCLGDIADLSSPNLDVLQRAAAIPIGRTPSLGKSVKLDREMLKKWVNRAIDGIPLTLTWDGAQVVTVVTPQQTIAPADLIRVARNQLSMWLSTRSESSAIELEQAPEAVTVPKGEFKVVARDLPMHQAILRRMPVTLDVWVDGHFSRTVVVHFSVNAYRKVLVSRVNIEPGQTVFPEDVEHVVSDIASKGVDVIEVREIEQGAVARSRLIAGQILMKANIQMRPLVSKGQTATLMLRNGELLLEGRVEVLQDASLGQVVPVRLSRANQSFYARVIGSGQLEMDL